MARLAAFDAHGGVLIDERPAFIDVTLQAWALDIERALHHARPRGHRPRGSKGAMRVVAIAALHEAFIDAVMRGHFELRAHVRMAGIAHLILLLRQ